MVENLQIRLESLLEVETACIHVDYEATHGLVVIQLLSALKLRQAID
jgi:hypothetical protein